MLVYMTKTGACDDWHPPHIHNVISVWTETLSEHNDNGFCNKITCENFIFTIAVEQLKP